MDAQDYALAANANHGLRRTNEDKRKAVHTALLMERWAMRSNVAISEHVGVSDKLVGKIRNELDSSTDAEFRVGRDGKKRKAPTPTSPVSGWQRCQPESGIAG